jgi:hypothetical protein
LFLRNSAPRARVQPQRVKANERVRSRAPFAGDPLRLDFAPGARTSVRESFWSTENTRTEVRAPRPPATGRDSALRCPRRVQRRNVRRELCKGRIHSIRCRATSTPGARTSVREFLWLMENTRIKIRAPIARGLPQFVANQKTLCP